MSFAARAGRARLLVAVLASAVLALLIHIHHVGQPEPRVAARRADDSRSLSIRGEAMLPESEPAPVGGPIPNDSNKGNCSTTSTRVESGPLPANATGGPASLLVVVQHYRGEYPWEYLELPVAERGADPANAVDLLRWFEWARREVRFSLYSLVACDYDTPGTDPSGRWQRPKRRDFATEAEFNAGRDAVRAERNRYLSDAGRWQFAYRLAFDIDARSRGDWPETRRIALLVRDLFRELTRGATLDAYSSGGAKCGLHLESPAPLLHALASKAHQELVRETARALNVPLVSERGDGPRAVAVEIDDTILGKIPCGSVLTAPGPRVEWDAEGRRPKETGVGKVWIPWNVLESLQKPDDYEAFVCEQRARGDDAIVPPWLKPSATPDELATVRLVDPEVFNYYIRRLEEESRSGGARGGVNGGPASASSTTSDPETLARLRGAIESIPDSAEKWKWIGAAAQRHGVAQHVRALAPSDEARKAFDDGVACFDRKESVSRPTTDEALVRRIDRALVALGRAPSTNAAEDGDDDPDGDGIGIEILDLVRRTRGSGRGGRIDVVVVTPRGTARLVGLAGKELMSYATIGALAAEEGLVLPDLGKAANSLWRRVVADAYTREHVEVPAVEETLEDALEGEILRFLREAPRAEQPADLDQGHVLVEGDRLLVKPGILGRALRRALPDDRFDREELAPVARELGLAEGRPRLSDGSRPPLWSFPVSVLEKKEEAQ